MVGLMESSSRMAYSTPRSGTQSPCPCSRPLLTRTSTGDTQTLKGRSGSVSVGPLGPGSHKVLFEPSSLASMGCDSKCDFAPPTVFLWLLLCPWTFGIFFGGLQHSPVDGCSSVSCDFGVLAGQDEHISFYSAICVRHFSK